MTTKKLYGSVPIISEDYRRGERAGMLKAAALVDARADEFRRRKPTGRDESALRGAKIKSLEYMADLIRKEVK